ncbi:MAG: glycosyltransferase [Thiohalocapsa sp.]|nr:glycosyltransferase [Thiohalocapsa sp.]MCF7989624.1 glycosyltransferase [Thiohalocapsa sp.]
MEPYRDSSRRSGAPVADLRAPAPSKGDVLDVSIIIKTLNEEANIARAVESALDALHAVRGEVIVADSVSSDRTVEIASQYPITVVQLAHAHERCCGAGPQLGFQHARGEFLYILDGDMEMDTDFLARAVAYMREHADVAGVAGIVEELGGGNYEFEARKSQGATWSRPGEQRWLDMGGLYRRAAVEAVGYFSNRNLHACEEQDLGMRLGQHGARLVRLPIRSVKHYGRCEDSWTLMRKRLKSGYSDGPGELVRAAIGQPMLLPALRSHRELVAMAGLWAAFLVSLLLLPLSALPAAAAAALLAALFAVMLIKKRSLAQAATGMINWQFRTAGFVRGLLRPQMKPTIALDSKVVARPRPVPAPAPAQAREA